MTELPVAGYSPEDPAPSAGSSVADVAADIAAAIKPDNPQGEVNVRVGAVTAVESTSPYRVQLDITGTAWLSRTADASLHVGDRVWAMQQGEITIVAGRLNSIDAFTPIGTLLPFAGSTAPSGWLIADGSAVSRTTYAALFAVCGTTYGAGNGTTTFNLPSLTNRVPVGSGGSYSRGNTGGASTVTLSTSQIPSHDHGGVGDHSHSISGTANSVGDHSHGYTNASSTRSDILAGGGTTTNNGSFGDSTSGSGGHSHSLSGSIGSAGGHTHSSVGSGSSHENMPPFVAMPYIIRVS